MKVPIIDYYMAVADNSDDFNVLCKALVKEGWEPYGGVSASVAQSAMGRKIFGGRIDYRHVFAQAMIKTIKDG